MAKRSIRTSVLGSLRNDVAYAKERMRTVLAIPMEVFKQADAVLKVADQCGVKVANHHAYGTYSSRLVLSLTVKSVEGLKAAPIMSFIGYLDGLLGAIETLDYASENCAERTFCFGSGELNSLKVNLTVDINDSPVCRKVKIGEKLEMVPQYVIQCAD